jgi:hypothetical protein
LQVSDGDGNLRSAQRAGHAERQQNTITDVGQPIAVDGPEHGVAACTGYAALFRRSGMQTTSTREDRARPNFLGIHRLQGCIFIQLTLVAGRSLEQKCGFYKQVADELHSRLGVRREDVVISLVPVDRDDWSFGNGEASLVK